LKEELGITCALRKGPTFVYRAEDPAGRGVEHEHVTILVGDTERDLSPKPDPEEVEEWKWVKLDALKADMKQFPALYAPWFHQGLDLLLSQTL
jgi:isopentenyl-diphosphate delta-isomerase